MRVPLLVECVICEKTVKTDRLLSQILFFWLPELWYVQVVRRNETTASATIYPACRKCFLLASEERQTFMTLFKAKFSETHR